MAEQFGIGCLGTTHPHVSVRLDVARRIEGISVVGVADDDPENQSSLEALAEFVDAPVLTSEALIARDDVHGIIVEPWTYEMVDVCIRCLEAGKHVLVEKPGGSNAADLARLEEAARRTGNVVQVGYNFRFSPMVDFAREVLDSGILGEIPQVQVHGAGPAGDATYRWFNLPEDIGGCFWEDGCHLVDLILWLFGRPNNVSARISKFPNVSGDDSLEDAAVATFEWDNTLMGFDFTSWEANEWLETWQFNIYGTHGTLRFQMCPARYELFLKEAKGGFRKGWNTWHERTFPTPWAGEPTPWEAWHIVSNKSFFFGEISAFRDACVQGTPSVIPASHGVEIARVMEACFESSRQDGRLVRLDDA